MKTLSLSRLQLGLVLCAALLAAPAQSSTESDALYTSSLRSIIGGRPALSIRSPAGSFDDISATFLDADQDMQVDGFVLEIFGTPSRTQTHGFATTEATGVTYLAFPIVDPGNFDVTAATFLPAVPATALPLVPITAQGSITVTRPNGDAILSIPLMIDPESLSDALFGNGFE